MYSLPMTLDGGLGTLPASPRHSPLCTSNRTRTNFQQLRDEAIEGCKTAMQLLKTRIPSAYPSHTHNLYSTNITKTTKSPGKHVATGGMTAQPRPHATLTQRLEQLPILFV